VELRGKEKRIYYASTLGLGLLVDSVLLSNCHREYGSIRIPYGNVRGNCYWDIPKKFAKVLRFILGLNYSPKDVNILLDVPPTTSLSFQLDNSLFTKYKSLGNLDYFEKMAIIGRGISFEFSGIDSDGNLNLKGHPYFMGDASTLEDFCNRKRFDYHGLVSPTKALFCSRKGTSIFVEFSTPHPMYNNAFAGCLNCINYHGKSYQGNILVCGMHPYGEEDCPDFEANYKSDHSVRNL
ncbi:MAG: hypothetical protein AB4372_27100, partial [Xenococcus sp. (in: cyanobacteria)]